MAAGAIPSLLKPVHTAEKTHQKNVTSENMKTAEQAIRREFCNFQDVGNFGTFMPIIKNKLLWLICLSNFL